MFFFYFFFRKNRKYITFGVRYCVKNQKKLHLRNKIIDI